MVDLTTIRVAGITCLAMGETVPEPPTGSRNALVGAVPVGSAMYALPTSAIYVDKLNGSDSNTGASVGLPVKTITRGVALCPANGFVVVRGYNVDTNPSNDGVYYKGGTGIGEGFGTPGTAELGITTSRTGVTIQNYPGERVWCDGSEVVPTWTTDTTTKPGSTIYSAPYVIKIDRSVQFGRGSVDQTGVAGYQWLNNTAGDPYQTQGQIANYYDQLFIDGVPQVQVATVAEVVAGTFWVRGTANSPSGQIFTPDRVFIGSNPAGKTVRVSNSTRAFCLVGDSNTLRGIGMRRFCPSNCDGGVVSLRRTNGRVENIVVEYNSGVGIDAYLNTRQGPSTLQSCTVNYSGLNAVHVELADDFVMNDCLIQYANWSHWNMAPAAGGIKITHSMRVTHRRCVANNNWCDGFWCDASVFDTDWFTCDAQNNAGHGFEYEISSKSRIADCLATGNGKDGFLIRGSNAVRMWNCTAANNQEVNFDVTLDNRRAGDGTYGTDGRHPSPTDPVYGAEGMDWVVHTVEIKNCVSARPIGSGGLLRIRTQPKAPNMPSPLSLAALGPDVDGNIYSRLSSSSPSQAWNLTSTSNGNTPYTTLAAAKAAATAVGVTLDAHSYTQDTDGINNDFTLKAATVSAAAGSARPLPSDIAAELGRAAGVASNGCWF